MLSQRLVFVQMPQDRLRGEGGSLPPTMGPHGAPGTPSPPPVASAGPHRCICYCRCSHHQAAWAGPRQGCLLLRFSGQPQVRARRTARPAALVLPAAICLSTQPHVCARAPGTDGSAHAQAPLSFLTLTGSNVTSLKIPRH